MIKIPNEYNYVGIFLTLSCPLRCDYCLNKHSSYARDQALRILELHEWLDFINKLDFDGRTDIPVTLQGGEPTVYPWFVGLVNNIRPDIKIDVLTNLYNPDIFRQIKPGRLKRDAKYASIRVSYHPAQQSRLKLTEDVYNLQREGYHIGIWGIDHPSYKLDNETMKILCEEYGIDFRLKEFLGFYQGKLYGTYKYKDAIGQLPYYCKAKMCRATELLIGPQGGIYGCHSHLYNDYRTIGHIQDTDKVEYKYRYCNKYGDCHPCDIKVKTNRLQEYGHTSVDIKEITDADIPSI